MHTVLLFLKWLVMPYGTTKVHPGMAFKYIRPPGMPTGLAEDITEAKLSRIYREQECKICGVKCWAWRKNAPPICTTWHCYHQYYTTLSNTKEGKKNDS